MKSMLLAGGWSMPIFLAQAQAGTVDNLPMWARLVVYVGLPIVALALLAWYHVQVVRDKDKAIAKLNADNQKLVREMYEELFDMARAGNEVVTQCNQTLNRISRDKR